MNSHFVVEMTIREVRKPDPVTSVRRSVGPYETANADHPGTERTVEDYAKFIIKGTSVLDAIHRTEGMLSALKADEEEDQTDAG